MPPRLPDDPASIYPTYPDGAATFRHVLAIGVNRLIEFHDLAMMATHVAFSALPGLNDWQGIHRFVRVWMKKVAPLRPVSKHGRIPPTETDPHGMFNLCCSTEVHPTCILEIRLPPFVELLEE